MVPQSYLQDAITVSMGFKETIAWCALWKNSRINSFAERLTSILLPGCLFPLPNAEKFLLQCIEHLGLDPCLLMFHQVHHKKIVCVKQPLFDEPKRSYADGCVYGWHTLYVPFRIQWWFQCADTPFAPRVCTISRLPERTQRMPNAPAVHKLANQEFLKRTQCFPTTPLCVGWLMTWCVHFRLRMSLWTEKLKA